MKTMTRRAFLRGLCSTAGVVCTGPLILPKETERTELPMYFYHEGKRVSVGELSFDPSHVRFAYGPTEGIEQIWVDNKPLLPKEGLKFKVFFPQAELDRLPGRLSKLTA